MTRMKGLQIWTTYQEGCSSDDEADSPRAVKAKESPLPSVSSSTTTWENFPTHGLHHRVSTTAAAETETKLQSSRRFSFQQSPSSALPRTVHSPYRPSKRTRMPKFVRSRDLSQYPWHFKLFALLCGILVLFWSVTGLLYASLPSWWWEKQDSPNFWNYQTRNFHPIHHQYYYRVETSPLIGLARTPSRGLSTSRRNSRKTRVQPPREPWLPGSSKPPRIQFDMDWVAKENTAINNNNNNEISPAPMESLCGYAAEMAILRHAQYFPAEKALGEGSGLVWIGPRWELLQSLLQDCPSVTLLQLLHALPDDPYERMQWLQKYPSLISSPDHHHVRFVELLPLGLQTRETTKTLLINNKKNTTTHVVWALETSPNPTISPTPTAANATPTLLTQLTQTLQMTQDLCRLAVSHVTIVAPEAGAPDWQQAVVKRRLALCPNLATVTWVSDVAALIPALQMRHPQQPYFWHVDRRVRQELLPELADENSKHHSHRGHSSHGYRRPWPCACECADPNEDDDCQPSAWDETATLSRAVTQGCTIVLYTVTDDMNLRDLPASEFREEEGKSNAEDSVAVVCNVAFVPVSSPLVQSIMQRVPNEELLRLGVEPQPGDDAQAIHQRKLQNLNGKLLYRGWNLLWVNTTWSGHTMLSLTPGRFWSSDVEYALYCNSLSTIPKHQDTKFMVHQMKRQAWPARNAKLGVEQYRLPPEPPRRALLLLAERRSKTKKRFTSLRKAMAEWEWDGTNSTLLERQAALYDQYDVWMNRQRHQRRFFKPEPLPFRYDLKHWTRTRWILHDFRRSPTAANFRCEWYQEVVRTEGSPALALAHILALQDMERRMMFGEPDEHTVQHTLARRMAFKEAVTDSAEWIPFPVEQNRPFAQLAYQLGPTLAYEPYPPERLDPIETAIYIRIISDHVMTAARAAYKD